MIKSDKYYLKNLQDIISDGTLDENPRPRWSDGIPAHSKFISQVWETYDLSKNEFPIPTLRNTAIKTGIREMLWIYQDQNSSLHSAREHGINWWESWNIGDDTIGQRYGATVSKYDLVNNILNGLKNDPFGRRHIMNLYQYSDLNETSGLFPCAYETLWSVRRVNDQLTLDMTLVQRSNDYLVAGYINKIQYVALQMMFASHLGYNVGRFGHLTQNLHVYDRHFNAMNEILTFDTIDSQPILALKENKNFYDFTIDDFVITGTKDIPKLSMQLEIAI